jgi:hypothetical protein
MLSLENPEYLNVADFEEYKRTRVANALGYVSSATKNPNTANQVAARMLGWGSYEAMQPRHAREESIKSGVHWEMCPFQGGRLTIKAGNIVVVLDPHESALIGRALLPMEESQYLCADNMDASCYFQEKKINLERLNAEAIKNHPRYTNEGGRAHIFIPFTQGNEVVYGELSITRTYEGLIIDLFEGEGDNVVHYDSIALMFTDADFSDEDEITAVDQANVYYAAPLQHGDKSGAVYRWMRRVDVDGAYRALTFFPGEEINISDLLFDSYEKAFDAVYARDEGGCLAEAWGVHPDFISEHGGFIAKVNITCGL